MDQLEILYDLDALERGVNLRRQRPATVKTTNLRSHLQTSSQCLMLVIGALFLLGYASEYADSHASLKADSELRRATPPPYGCAGHGGPQWADLGYAEQLRHTLDPSASAAACSEYWRALHRSQWPNAWLVLCNLLARTIGNPLHLLLDALGRGVHALLQPHSSFMQLALLFAAASALVGIVYSLGSNVSTFALGKSAQQLLPSSVKSSRSPPLTAQAWQSTKQRGLARLRAAPRPSFRQQRKALTLPTYHNSNEFLSFGSV